METEGTDQERPDARYPLTEGETREGLEPPYPTSDQGGRAQGCRKRAYAFGSNDMQGRTGSLHGHYDPRRIETGNQ